MAQFALMNGDYVLQLFPDNPGFHEGQDVVDVSTVSGIQVGWWRQPDGSFQALQPPITLTEPVRQDYHAKVDQAAEAARNAFVTPGSAKAMVYVQKRREADLVADDPADPADPNNYPLLAASVGLELNLNGQVSASVNEVGALVRQKSHDVDVALATIETLAITANYAIRDAVTEQQANAALVINWPRPS
jgi:hypothetical protein